MKSRMFLRAWVVVIFPLLFSCVSRQSASGDEPPASHPERIPEQPVGFTRTDFSEVWAYVVAGREDALRPNLPITDVVYFGAEVDRYGHVVDIPSRKKLASFGGRVHASIACASAGLTHFILEPGSAARKIFVAELLEMASQYDGLNIDLEQVPLKDADNFISFLADLRKGLGKKMLSVCVPARSGENQTYNYVKLAAACDRVFVMAYDEHWSSSAPGPVASMGWCRAVASYALSTIGEKKLVMGIPFYGRGWGDRSTSRALVHSTTQSIRNEFGIAEIERENGIPKFTYEVLVKVTVYFEDVYSLTARMEMYSSMGITRIGFWRLGQEDTGIWQYIGAGGTSAVAARTEPAKVVSKPVSAPAPKPVQKPAPVTVKTVVTVDGTQFRLNDILRARDAAGLGGLSRAEMDASMNKSFSVNGVSKTFREWQNIINSTYGVGEKR